MYLSCNLSVPSYIDRSRILQVKAAQLVPSEKYKAGFTLRFPRVVRIRLDKDWHQCLSLKELQDLESAFGGRYARRKYGDTLQNGEEAKKRKKPSQTNKKVINISIFLIPRLVGIYYSYFIDG